MTLHVCFVMVLRKRPLDYIYHIWRDHFADVVPRAVWEKVHWQRIHTFIFWNKTTFDCKK
jgi:hypothetical protein